MLEDPPLLTIKAEFDRVPPDVPGKLAGCQTGHLIDAMFGRGAMDGTIKPVLERHPLFVGTAFPVWTGPSDNLAIAAAIAHAKPGDVIVAASDSFIGTAVTGDIVALMAKNAGCAAIVIDGAVRDLSGLEDVGLPVFACGLTPNSCVRSGPGKVGLPIVAGGVRVEAGDLVMGDRDGVVVVPKSEITRVVGVMSEIRAAEAALIDRVKSERLTRFDWMDALLKSDKVRYVD